MRLLGKFTEANAAGAARNALLERKIDCRIERAADSWELWALDENQLAEAREVFRQFLVDPRQNSPVAAAKKTVLRARERETPPARQRLTQPRRSRIFNRANAPLSLAFITVCVGLWLTYTIFPAAFLYFRDWLQIEPLGGRGLEAVKNGQIWRLFTPVLLHAPVFGGGGFNFMGLLHIAFNMLWVYDLAPLIERKHGSWYLLALALVIGVGSNLTQYFLAGANFIGFSGVVYGLLGFLWLRGKTDPRYGVFLNPGIVTFMLIWLAFCVLMTSGVANGAHLGGLVIGAAWGALSGLAANRNRR
jgi:GlpG protein